MLAIHDEQLAEHGGLEGIRDENALDSALGAPKNLEAYGDPPPDLADLAAAYAFAIARNHGFVDGNKRTSLAVTTTFLLLNRRRLAPGPDVFTTWMAIGAGAMEAPAIAAWLRPRI